MRNKSIPLVDIFSGPGGLSEGFASAGQEKGVKYFKVNLSIEKDSAAHSTLELRAFFREFPWKKAPKEYYDFLRGEITRTELFEKYPSEALRAQKIAWKVELGGKELTEEKLYGRIQEAIGNSKEWVLIGGPPCQAYSSVGRSRNKGIIGYRPEEDSRHFLYQEYLKIISRFWPPVFVMENVKGIISSKVNGGYILDKIFKDLCDPCKALNIRSRNYKIKAHQYSIFSLVKPVKFSGYEESTFNSVDYVIRSEHFGVPQSRHRLILLGIRNDLDGIEPTILTKEPEIPVKRVLGGLPRLRSGLSRDLDSPDRWRSIIKSSYKNEWMKFVKNNDDAVFQLITKTIRNLRIPRNDRGGEFVSFRKNNKVEYNKKWYVDRKLKGACNCTTKAHMASDLSRYLFAACFAKIHKTSPRLVNFPTTLLPNHKNVPKSMNHDNFADRFRVQIDFRPSTTITSHLAKDGHYFIHPDPSQCRSLTVREAARIQTFPDNYFFCGDRTPQFVQVGNAVPPLLAKKIAIIVKDIFERLRLTF